MPTVETQCQWWNAMPTVECNANGRDAINRVSTEPRVSTIIDASTIPDAPIPVTKN